MNKQYYNIIGTLIAIILVVIIGVFVVINTSPKLAYASKDIKSLQAESIATTKFKDIEEEMTVEQVKEVYPEIKQLNTTGDYQAYQVKDEKILYKFYFKDNKLTSAAIYV